MGLREDAGELAGELGALRRELHGIPEIGLNLPLTQRRVLRALEGLPLEISVGSGLSSITAVLRGRGSGRKAVLLRGDMDALPVTEDTGLPFASRHDGVMHACGHDLHTAGLVGAARLLCARRDELGGDVVFMFQPGEEGFDGARLMVEEGVLEAAGRPLDAAFGLHVFSGMFPKGVFASRPGPLMSGADGLFVRVIGEGGHGALPHLARDPVPVACELVTALQSMVTRRFSVFDPVVLTVGSFHAGTQRNIIPAEAAFEATVRSFSPDTRERVGELAVRMCEDIVAAHGLTAEIRYTREFPVTVNDEGGYEFVAGTVREVFGEERFQRVEDPIMPSEDFSHVLNRVPGAFVFLGATVGDDPLSTPNNHSPRAVFDEDVLSDGAALLAELAARTLKRAPT